MMEGRHGGRSGFSYCDGNGSLRLLAPMFVGQEAESGKCRFAVVCSLLPEAPGGVNGLCQLIRYSLSSRQMKPRQEFQARACSRNVGGTMLSEVCLHGPAQPAFLYSPSSAA